MPSLTDAGRDAEAWRAAIEVLRLEPKFSVKALDGAPGRPNGTVHPRGQGPAQGGAAGVAGRRRPMSVLGPGCVKTLKNRPKGDFDRFVEISVLMKSIT